MCHPCENVPRPSRGKVLRRRRPPRLQSGRGSTRLDPVRALRVRMLIERCIIVGAGPAFHLQTGQPLPPNLLYEPDRGGAAVAAARQMALYLAHVGCGLTLAQSGRLYGRERTTAAHACAVIEDRREDSGFDRLICVLEAAVRLGLTQIDGVLAATLGVGIQRLCD